MKDEAMVEVPPRRADENVVEWMQAVCQQALYLDHRARSPQCRADKMEYAKIPAPENASFLGGTPQVN